MVRQQQLILIGQKINTLRQTQLEELQQDDLHIILEI